MLKSGTAQFNPINRSKLSTKPAGCRSVMPKSTFTVRQIWIAASLNCCCRLRLSVGGGVQSISGSNQIESDPRYFSPVLYEGQFLALYFVGAQLLIPPSYHAGFMQ